MARGEQKVATQEQSGDGYIAQAGAGSGGNAGDAFDVAGHGRGAGQGAENGTHGIGDQGPAYAGNLAIFDESALFAHAYQGANVVEKIDEQECEQDFEKA